MAKWVLVVGLLILVVVSAGSWATAEDFRGDPKPGMAVYQRHCQRCHGESGNGMGPEGGDLIVPPANFHLGKSRMKTDRELFIAIQDGVLFSPMHAWRGRLTEDEIKHLIVYIRLFASYYPQP